MNHRKLILIILSILLACIWIYNGYQVMEGSNNKSSSNAVTSKQDKLIKISEAFTYKGDFRDPFEPYIKVRAAKSMEQDGNTEKSNRKKDTQVKDSLPLITINGIMWDAVKPMAVLQFQDGSTQLVSPGQMISDIKVESINKNSVTLSRNKKKWVIK